jgi:hypothetical protein
VSICENEILLDLNLNFKIGDKVNVKNEYWALLIKLLEIKDQFYTNNSTTSSLEKIIEENHRMSNCCIQKSILKRNIIK